MSVTTIAEALGPSPVRTSRIVREHEVLRIAAAIQGDDKDRAAAAARGEVLAWTEGKSGTPLPPEAWKHQDFERFSGGRDSIAVRFPVEKSDIWAIRTDDPDKTVAGRIWTTEVAIWT